MTGIEVILLIIGAMIFAASFIFTSKSDTPKNAEIRLSDKQKEDIKNQIMTVFDEQMENLSEQTEIKLDKLSNEKIMEMNDYSETILGEINRNHNEVMFMYDMLNEKKKEINNTVRDLNVVKKSKKRQNNRVKRPDRRLFLTSWMPFLSRLQTKLVQMYLLLMNNLRKREQATQRRQLHARAIRLKKKQNAKIIKI